jgi:hypothetical protein
MNILNSNAEVSINTLSQKGPSHWSIITQSH